MRFSTDQILMKSIFFFTYFVYTSANITQHRNWNLVNPAKCGESLQLAERIIGGEKAALGQYPWIARLGFALTGTKVFVVYNCGAALINERYVLSAAHCVVEEPKIYVSFVRLGENYMSTEIDCFEDLCAPPIQDIKPEALIVHNDYSKPHKYANDILLIRLEKPAALNDFVVPICLPFGRLMEIDYMSQAMEVAGWGVTNSTTRAKTAKTGPGQMCFGEGNDKDSCVGDSGGPLMKVEAMDGPPRYFLMGVVSFGPAKCGLGPAIYSSVRYYLPWILDQIGS